MLHSHSHSHSHSHAHGHKNENNNTQMNVRAAFIHVVGDLVQSVGVLVAATLIWYDNDRFHIADPICTLIFSLIVICTTFRLMSDILSVLMQSSPKGLDAAEIEKELTKLSNVSEVHDLHVWSLSMGKPTLSVHLFVESFKCDCCDQKDKSVDTIKCTDYILRKAQKLMSEKFNIEHCTIQIEWPHDQTYHENDFV